MMEWINGHHALIAWLFWSSVVTFFGTLIIIPVMIIRIPEDYFIPEKRVRLYVRSRHPLTHLMFVALKNGAGLIFIAAGIAMLVLPGQGLITILIGIMLCDFPGKYRLERKVVGWGKVLTTINWIRKKGNKPPLKLSESGNVEPQEN